MLVFLLQSGSSWEEAVWVQNLFYKWQGMCIIQVYGCSMVSLGCKGLDWWKYFTEIYGRDRGIFPSG